jgi:hypothetical protein
MPFVRVYFRETQELVFDAHDKAFAFYGGVCLRLHNVLLQEIELEGRVAWMEGAAIDRSRVIGLCEELNDARKRQ